MIAYMLLLLFTAVCVPAQSLVAADGTSYVCVTDGATQGVQAFSTICPQRAIDGTPLADKRITVTYDSAPGSYEISAASQGITVVCGYAVRACFYDAAGGGAMFQLRGGPDGFCPLTTINNGMQPARVSGGNFRKRQTSPGEVQMRQAQFTCPRQSEGGERYLNQISYTYVPEASAPTSYFSCRYVVGGTQFFCFYDADTGILALNGRRCPTTSCPSDPYMAQMRKRAIDSRQVKAADLRARRTASAAEAGMPRRKTIKRRTVEAK